MSLNYTVHKIYDLDSGKLIFAVILKFMKYLAFKGQNVSISKDFDRKIPLDDERFHWEGLRLFEPGNNEQFGVELNLLENLLNK
jgi:hypothetical protein